jgi:hypothetical protein
MKPWRFFLVTGFVLAVPILTAGSAHAQKSEDHEIFQIVKATENRVWRLNKLTGEIAVCTLDGDNLICATSTKAITPPALTYEEREATKRQATADEEKRRETENAKDLEFLDRVIAAFRILVGAAIERESGK